MKDDAHHPYAVEEKWGEAAKAGFSTIPDVLFKHQATLGLTDTELVVLLNICMHWWSTDRLPYPQTSTIVQRMGAKRSGGRRAKAVSNSDGESPEAKASPRRVQRALLSLQKKGLIRRVRRGDALQFDLSKQGHQIAERDSWDLSGLKARLEGLAKRDPQYLRKVSQGETRRQLDAHIATQRVG